MSVFVFLVGYSVYAYPNQPSPVTFTLHNGPKAKINTYNDADSWEQRTAGNLRSRNNEMRDLKHELKLIQYGIDDKRTELEDETTSSFASAADGSPF